MRRQSASLQWGRDLVIAEMGRSGIEELGGKLLQWGRDLVIAEIGSRPRFTGSKGKLQWGRDLVIAEIFEFIPLSPRSICFNGAAIW